MSFVADVVTVNSSSNAPVSLFSEGTAFDAVLSGQVAVRRADGRLTYAVDPALPGASLRPIEQASDVYLGLQSAPTQVAFGTQGRIAGCVLSNGNVLHVHVLAVAPYLVRMGIFDPHGVALAAPDYTWPATAASGGGGPLVCAAALAGGGAVVAWNAGGAPSFAIIDNNGGIVKSATTFGATSSITALSVAPLAGGGFVVVYNQVSVNEVPIFAVFSAIGVAVKAPTVLRAAPASNLTAVASNVAALSNGGFACAYSINTGGANTNYVKVFDAVGVQVGVEIVLRVGAAINSGVVIRGFGNGGFCTVETDGVRISTFDQTGTLVGLPLAKEPGQIRNKLHVPIPGVGCLGWQLLVAWHSAIAGTICISPIYYTGPSVGTVVVTSSALSGCDLQTIGIGANGGYVACVYADTAGKLAISVYNGAFVFLAQAIYSNITSDTTGAATIPQGFAAPVTSPINSNVVTLFLSTTTTAGNVTFCLVNHLVERVYPIGVFSSSAIAGAAVTYQFAGVAALRSGFVRELSKPILPANQTLFITGNAALMYGVTR